MRRDLEIYNKLKDIEVAAVVTDCVGFKHNNKENMVSCSVREFYDKAH